jgi:ubiquinone/menaquinone biosynthesis C-methylase UbiE
MGFYSDRVFPVICGGLTRRFEPDRAELLGTATGRVLEIGPGAGTGFVNYTQKAREVVGLEYSAGMLDKAHAELQRLAEAGELRTAVALTQGSVTDLEFEDGSFDTVISFLVFCSVPDPESAAREVHRVLKPGGRFLFFEHVRAPDPGLARWQRRLNPIWNRLACGCNLDRDTRALFESVGFRFDPIDEFDHPNSMRLTRRKIRGAATK